MAEGGYELDEFDDLVGGLLPKERDPDEEETGFMNDFDEMDEAPSTTPPWASGLEMPDGLDEENLASNDDRDRVVARFKAERSKYVRPANLEFKVAKSGDLWVKWGRDWKLLTWKNDPTKFLSRSSIERYGLSLARALGVTPEARGVANEQIGELAEKADAAVRAGDDDPDRCVDDFQGGVIN